MMRRFSSVRFPIAGKHSVVEALRCGHYAKAALWLARERLDDPVIREGVDEARRREWAIKNVSSQELDRLFPGPHSHQGIVLLLDESPRPCAWDELLNKVQSQSWSVIAVLDGAGDHQNIGAMVRSAALFGVSALMAPQDRSAPLIHPTVWRIAQGGAQHVKLVPLKNLANALRELKERGFWIIGAHAAPIGRLQPLLNDQSSWPEKLAVVFGSEDKGLRILTANLCDFIWTLPQERPGGLDSLNLSAAATIFFWENYRRRISESAHSSMDRVLPSEGKDGGSIPPGRKVGF